MNFIINPRFINCPLSKIKTKDSKIINNPINITTIQEIEFIDVSDDSYYLIQFRTDSSIYRWHFGDDWILRNQVYDCIRKNKWKALEKLCKREL
jgi:hypothetical protein